MKTFFNFPIIVIILFYPFAGLAQNQNIIPKNILKDDSAAITSIAIYPESVRKNILHACMFPGALVKIELLQEKTSSTFKTELDKYSKETQINIWNLARYPGLIAGITEGGKKTKEELKQIAARYPEEIYNTILECGRKDFDLLDKINSIRVESDEEFENLISEYPEKDRNTFRKIVLHPEVLKILSDGMRMTVVLGEAYKKDSSAVNILFDSISTAYATQNAKELEEWKEGLKNNPEAQKEMEDAAKKFAEDEGYDDEELIIYNEQVVINYVCHPYPYWMGYPSWYAYPYWYPYPYWYDWGFYWTPGGLVYIGFPSSYFTYWFFYHPHHHYYYNHFTDYCLTYNYGHRNSRTEFNHEINNWVASNESKLPAQFFNADEKRPDRIKEFGKLSIEYNEIIRKNPEMDMSMDEYLQNNAVKYPNLKPDLSRTDKPERDLKPVIYDSSKDDDPVYNTGGRKQPDIKIPKKPDPVEPRINPKPRYEPKVNPRPRTGKR